MDPTDLTQRIEALEQWKKDREAQQITFPLDYESQVILSKYFMHITGVVQYEVLGAASHIETVYTGSQDLYNFVVTPNYINVYTVSTSADTLTSSTIRFTDDTAVSLFTNGTYPAPFAVNTEYYVINSTGTTFQLSLTVGGAAIDITTTGTGSQYIIANL